jgi:hypothetical protein
MGEFVDPAARHTLFASRRREPRVEVDRTITVRTVSADGPTALAVHDVGFRGFAIETAEPIAPRTRSRFEFRSPDGPLFTADAVSVHCHERLDGSHRWVSGWEFPEQPNLDEALERLIDKAIGVLVIE